MPLFRDQLGREIMIKEPPKRIVSVVPSQTEYLYHLGLEQEVIGITKFCVHPESWFRNKARVGGTKQLKTDQIAALQPDLIIANKEENTKEQIEELAEKFPVWVSDIHNLDESLEMMEMIGEICDKTSEAQSITQQIKTDFQGFDPVVPSNPTCLYLIWRNPYMAAGTETFINDLLKRCGFSNLADSRYPEMTREQITQLQPEYILLSSEPYPFSEKHMHELQACCPTSKIVLVDGEYFSWYGSRLMGSVDYINRLFKGVSE